MRVYERKFKQPPHKLKARDILNKAIKNGSILRLPCEVCGELKSEGHHDDYSKPLEVRWLCMIHHKQVHLKPKKIKVVVRNSRNQHTFKSGKDNPSFGKRWKYVNGKRQYLS